MWSALFSGLRIGNLCASQQERTAVLEALADKAKMAEETFNKVPGMSCNTVQGAMYAFPRIELPQKAIEEAKVDTGSHNLISLRSLLVHLHVLFAFTFLRPSGCTCLCVCRRRVRLPTCFTVWNCWRRRESVWYLEVVLAKGKERFTSGLHVCCISSATILFKTLFLCSH